MRVGFMKKIGQGNDNDKKKKKNIWKVNTKYYEVEQRISQ